MYGDQFGEFVCGYRGLKGSNLNHMGIIVRFWETAHLPLP